MIQRIKDFLANFRWQFEEVAGHKHVHAHVCEFESRQYVVVETTAQGNPVGVHVMRCRIVRTCERVAFSPEGVLEQCSTDSKKNFLHGIKEMNYHWDEKVWKAEPDDDFRGTRG